MDLIIQMRPIQSVSVPDTCEPVAEKTKKMKITLKSYLSVYEKDKYIVSVKVLNTV